MKLIKNLFLVGLFATASVSAFANPTPREEAEKARSQALVACEAIEEMQRDLANATSDKKVAPATLADKRAGIFNAKRALGPGINLCRWAQAPTPAVASVPNPAPAATLSVEESARIAAVVLENNRLQQMLARRTQAEAAQTVVQPAVISTAVARTGGTGDTFQTSKGGDRECVVYFNGVRMYSQFVWGDPTATKQACDTFAASKYSLHMHGTPTAAEVAVVQASHGVAVAVVSATASVYTAPTATPSPALGGNHTCELKFNGGVVETAKTVDDAACKAWTQQKAAEKGWIAAK